MIKFKRISLKNFMSYGNVATIVEFDNPGTTLIVGENLDDTGSGTGNNGVGKTSIVNALTYAVYDKPISKISLDNLVNNINKKNMEVILDFEKEHTQYRIRRVRKEKAGQTGNYVQFFINGEDKTPDSVDNTNKLIEGIMGIPYDLFVRIVTFSATLVPFLDLPARHPTQANQTDIIEELFELKTLSEKAEMLKKKISGTEQSLETHTLRIEHLKKEHDRHTGLLNAAQKRVTDWDVSNQVDIARLKKQLITLEKINIEQQRELLITQDEIETTISELEARVKGIDAELTSKKSEKKSVEKHLLSLQTQLKSHTTTITRSEGEIEHLRGNKCPTCKQKFKDTEEEIQKREAAIVSANEQIELLTSEQNKCNTKITKLDESIAQLSAERKEWVSKVADNKEEYSTIEALLQVKTKEDLDEINNKSVALHQKLTSQETAVNPFIEPLEELQRVELDPLDMAFVNALTRMVEHQKFLHKLLTNKTSFVRKKLLNKNIPFLNLRLSKYLTDLGLPHSVEFSHEMTAEISQFGRPLDFGNLSNGQRARVNIALSLAFRDVLQSIHTEINVCMLDEVLDVGLDTVGVTCAARMLKRKARDEGLSMFIVSHRDEIDSVFDRKLTVQLSKGFSFVKQEGT